MTRLITELARLGNINTRAKTALISLRRNENHSYKSFPARGDVLIELEPRRGLSHLHPSPFSSTSFLRHDARGCNKMSEITRPAFRLFHLRARPLFFLVPRRGSAITFMPPSWLSLKIFCWPSRWSRFLRTFQLISNLLFNREQKGKKRIGGRGSSSGEIGSDVFSSFPPGSWRH